MIDYFAIGLSHALIFYVCWRLLLRDDLDDGALPPPDHASTAARTQLSAGARHRLAQGGDNAADTEAQGSDPGPNDGDRRA